MGRPAPQATGGPDLHPGPCPSHGASAREPQGPGHFPSGPEPALHTHMASGRLAASGLRLTEKGGLVTGEARLSPQHLPLLPGDV